MVRTPCLHLLWIVNCGFVWRCLQVLWKFCGWSCCWCLLLVIFVCFLFFLIMSTEGTYLQARWECRGCIELAEASMGWSSIPPWDNLFNHNHKFDDHYHHNDYFHHNDHVHHNDHAHHHQVHLSSSQFSTMSTPSGQLYPPTMLNWPPVNFIWFNLRPKQTLTLLWIRPNLRTMM